MTPTPRLAELDDHLADCRFCRLETTGQLCPKGADLRRLADAERPLPTLADLRPALRAAADRALADREYDVRQFQQYLTEQELKHHQRPRQSRPLMLHAAELQRAALQAQLLVEVLTSLPDDLPLTTLPALAALERNARRLADLT